MSFAMACMQRMSGAGLSCRGFLARVAFALVLSLSVASFIADPYTDIVMAADAGDVLDSALVFTPVENSGAPAQRVASGRVPDFRFDDLRAERLASSHDWCVPCVVQARGPPA